MEKRFQNKVVLVTGAAGGIGRAAALGFCAEGARIAVADANEVDGERTAALLREQGADTIFIKVDVSQGGSCAAMVKSTISAFGRLDIAFNNAGIAGAGFALADEEEIVWDRIIAVNLKGVYLSMKQ